MTATAAIRDEWFPVADAAGLEPGTSQTFDLLDDRFLLTCSIGGQVRITRDTCPHRGAQLSLGSYDGERIRCPYHGWEFDEAGTCVHQPAHPDRSPPSPSGLTPLATCEQYGLWWVSLGDEPRKLPVFGAYDSNPHLGLTLGPAIVESSGPRIVENFLDQAHFPFVHAGYLGEEPHTTVARYRVETTDAELRLSDVTVWQPNPGPRSTTGGPVAYDYSVSHPYAATLTKIPSDQDGGDLGGFSILLVASPITEVRCRVWRVVVVRDPAVDVVTQRTFNETIFDQDLAVVESQRPRRLPVDARLEQHQPADAGSIAYRRWLVQRGISYGTTTGPTGDGSA